MKAQRGFTLIELMISLVILGVLSAMAVPSFQKLIVTSSITSDANAIMSDLALARSEAARTGSPVTICLSTDGATCNSTSWSGSTGRLVFTDSSTSGTIGTVDSSAGDKILRYTASLSNTSNKVNTNNMPNAGYLTYTSTGVVKGLSSGNDATLTVCRSTKYSGTTITISVTGRASSSTVATLSSC
jgi:type IV fimbrial biogenesis protein FimT